MKSKRLNTVLWTLLIAGCGQWPNNEVNVPKEDGEKQVVTEEKETKPESKEQVQEFQPVQETKPKPYNGPSFVELLLPEERAEVKGKVSVMVSASPNIYRLDFLVEETLVFSGTAKDAEHFEWDSGSVSDGTFRLYVIGRTQSETIKVRRSVVVKNMEGEEEGKARLFILDPQPGSLVKGEKLAVQLSASSDMKPFYVRISVDDLLRGRSLNLSVDSIDISQLEEGDHVLSAAAYDLRSDRIMMADQVIFRVEKKEKKKEIAEKIEPPCNHPFEKKEELLQCLSHCSLTSWEEYGTYVLKEPQKCGFDCEFLGVRSGIRLTGEDEWTRYVEGYCLKTELSTEQ